MTAHRRPAKAIALRHRAAVVATDPRDDAKVLEIGCGHGVATRLLLDRLPRGHLVALDRSAKMIETVRSKCAEYLKSGRLELHALPVEEVDFGEQRFDRIVAVNVNLDLRLRDTWPRLLAGLLKPRGKIILAFEPPLGAEDPHFPKGAAKVLNEVGFEVRTYHRTEGRVSVALVVASAVGNVASDLG